MNPACSHSTLADPADNSAAGGSAGNSSGQEILDWLEGFRQQHGHSPRILHCGNIANNGYNNAKLLVQAGIDCDVLCNDYYHIMGCPEWEDADFEGKITNQFRPDWSSVDLHGFRRPMWFAQGPLDICVLYLIARKDNRHVVAGALWRMLLATCHLSPTGGNFAARSVRFLWLLAARVICMICVLARRPPTFDIRGKYRRYLEEGQSRLQAVGRITVVTGFDIFLLPFWLVDLVVVSLITALAIGRVPGWYFRSAIEVARRIVRGVTTLLGLQAAGLNGPPYELAASFRKAFPDRSDQLLVRDVEQYAPVLPLFRELFDRYDIIEATATWPIYPLLVSKRPYVAYEHGTLRDIPFEPDSLGRTTAISYRLADHSFVTNPDCIDAARKLQLQDFSYVPHVIDQKYYRVVPESERKPIVFCPARHDWQVKGTDRVIRGFAEFVADADEFQLVMANWGEDLDRSRKLIDELGITDRVQLVEPLPIVKLIRMICESRILVDQFMGYFGGIAPAALASGTPLVMHLDFSKYEWCWNQPPPYFEAANASQVSHALHEALACDMDAYRKQASLWIEDHYWYKEVVREHLRVYGQLLGKYKSTAVG